MKAYYKQGWGVSFIIMGIVLLALNLMVMSMGKSNPMGLFLGAFIIIMGAMYLTKPAFELRATELGMFNLFGMEIKTHRFNQLSDFQVIDEKIYISSEGKSKRVRISKMMIKTSDWEEFLRKITGDDMSRELHNI